MQYLTEIKGNILLSKENYIAHQCNCVTNKPKGLSEQIFKKYPYSNTYKNREIHSIPGTIDICQNIINMYAQYYPSIGKYKNDTNNMRIQWFKDCLEKIKDISDIQNKSIAMPYKIGCGLAGGVT